MRVADLFHRALMFVPVLAVAVAQAACNDNGYKSPTAVPSPGPPAAPQAPIVSPDGVSWYGLGELTVLSCTGCCSSDELGRTSVGIRWNVRLSGSSVGLYNLDADMAYSGTLEGRRFVVDYPVLSLGTAEHSRIEGEFAPDLMSFEADESYVMSGSASVCQGVLHHRVRASS